MTTQRTPERFAILAVLLLLAGCDTNCEKVQEGQWVTHIPTGEKVMVDFIDFRLYVRFNNHFDDAIETQCGDVR